MNFKDKSLLVTGANGFIGSHLTEMLVEKGAHVKALSHYNSFNFWGWIEDLNCLNEIEILSGDIRDPQYCRRIIKNVDIVFHLAALIAIPYSYVAPYSYVETNVKGTLNICQAAVENGCEHVIHTSTSEVYGTAQYVPIDEKHPLQPQSPYSASKIGADAIAMSFYHAYSLPLTIARPFNTYGPRQSARAVIPTIITQLLTGEKEIKLGSLHPKRDLNYVKDICMGFLEIAKSRGIIGEEINIASGTEISIEELTKKIIHKINPEAKIVSEAERIRPSNSEVERLSGSAEKMRKLTDWTPEYDLERGLSETIEWFRRPENLERYKARTYNI